MPHGQSIKLKIVSCLDLVDPRSWDECAGISNPFVSHAFLNTLEQSGSVKAETGWLPQHLTLEDASGKLIGAVPCYLKNHSYGEYVFDWGWAEAFERAGGAYYPKLQVSVPFSPVTGPRILVASDKNIKGSRRILVKGLKDLANEHKVSSLHITFCDKRERDMLGKEEFLKRLGQQFHWQNEGYDSFDDFLTVLNSRKRKNIRKERKIANSIAKVRILTGDDIKPKHMEIFYNFYISTIEKKWSHAYLNRDFFMLLRENLASKIVLIMAKDHDDYIGAALNFLGTDTLFGRNWGGLPNYPMLYFEVCFYRAIDFAIENKLNKVEAGAQGPHKISRGYLPSETYSAHWIRNENFREAIAQFLKKEEEQTQWEMAALKEERSPFKKEHI